MGYSVAMSTRVHISLPVEVLAAVEKVRGDVPRAVWIRRAVEAKLPPTLRLQVGEARELREGPPEPTVGRTVEVPVAPVEKEPELPSDAPSTEGPDDRAGIRTPAPPRRAFKCRSCDFTAGSEKARCPRHGGALVSV